MAEEPDWPGGMTTRTDSMVAFSADPHTARLASPISKTRSSAGPGAPPCSGPLSAPIAPTMAETRSEPVDMITRAVKVEAFNP